VSVRVLGYVAIAEAASFLLLLLAMVFKYGLDEPIGVEVLGPVHGALFLAFVGLAAGVSLNRRWGWRRTAVVLASAVIPVAGYVVGHRLLQETAREAINPGPGDVGRSGDGMGGCRPAGWVCVRVLGWGARGGVGRGDGGRGRSRGGRRSVGH